MSLSGSSLDPRGEKLVRWYHHLLVKKKLAISKIIVSYSHFSRVLVHNKSCCKSTHACAGFATW